MNNAQSVANQAQEELSPLENKMTGSKNTYITKELNVQVGGNFNYLSSTRTDPKGKTTGSGVHVQAGGLTTDMRATSHTEPVAVPNIMGDYNIMVANKYSLHVGANGIKIATNGNMEITSGGIMGISAQSMAISSKDELLIDAETIKIVADNLSIGGRVVEKAGASYKSIGIDSNLGVDGNLTVSGGAHIEGDMTVQSITAPAEFQETETTLSYNTLIGGRTIGYVDITRGSSSGRYSVISVASTDFSTSAHSHTFANIPLQLCPNNDAVREQGTGNNSPELVTAKPVANGGRVVDRSTYRPPTFARPTRYRLPDDCSDESAYFDKLIDQIANGEINKEDVEEYLTKASESVLVTDTTCAPCD